MYDILLQTQPKIDTHMQALLPSLDVTPQGYVLVTVHRPANTDNPTAMQGIAHALNKLEMPVIFPVHPRTRKFLEYYDIVWGKYIHLIEPVGYLDMLTLERGAHRILTDSGGVQKEAFLLGVPCVTIFGKTEWPETVEAGWNVLVDSCWQAILEAVNLPKPKPTQQNPFGSGDAAVRIAQSWQFQNQGAK
jgi:UDP-N-acetylglucosamine 2-epimerase